MGGDGGGSFRGSFTAPKGSSAKRREAAAAREAELSRAIDIARKYDLQDVIERAVRIEHLSPREALEDYDLIAPGEEF